MTSKTASPITEQSSEKTIDSAINSIKKTYAKGNENIHLVACAIIEHAKQYGNCNRAANLINALPKTFRRTLLAKWFTLYSPILVSVNKGAFKAHVAKEGTKEDKPYDVEAAKANPFYDMPEAQKDESLYISEDFVEGLQRIISKAAKALKDNKVANDDIEDLTAKIATLSTVVSSFNATKMDNQKLGTWEEPKAVSMKPAVKLAA